MGVTKFPNGVSSFGMLVSGGMFPNDAPGSHFFVDSVNGSDSNDGTEWSKAKAKISSGYALCTANKNDVLHVAGGATAYIETAVLALSKSYTHIIGHTPPTMSGGRVRITPTVTTATAGEVVISGVGSTYVNIHFQHGASATATSVVGVSITGDGRNSFINCNFEGPTNATVAGGTAIKPLMLTSTQDNSFYHCQFGGNTIMSASAAGACVHFAGSNNTNNTFEDCFFQLYNSTTTSAFISYVDGAMPDSGWTLFKDCIFQGCANVAVADPIRYTTAGHGCTIIKDCALSGLGLTVWATGAWKTHVDVCTPVGSATGGLGIHPA